MNSWTTNLRLVMAAVAVLFASASATARETVTVGIVSASTGPFAEAGRAQLNGFRLAAEEIAKTGGFRVGGRKYTIELKIYDTRCNAAAAAAAMRRLITVDRVPVVLGELCTAAARAEAEIARDRGIPIIFTAPSADSLTAAGNPSVFRMNPRTGQLDSALARFIGGKGWLPLAYLAWDNRTGRTRIRTLNRLLPNGAGEGYVGFLDQDDADVSGHISKLRTTGAKALMLMMGEERGHRAIRQIRDAGLDIRLIGPSGASFGDALKRLGASRLAGMVQHAAVPPHTGGLPRFKAFGERYRARFKEEARGFAAHSYDGLFAVVDAMRRAGTVSDGAAIRDALARTEMQGVTGPVKFDGSGQNSPTVFVTEWCANGRQRIVAPEHAAGSCDPE